MAQQCGLHDIQGKEHNSKKLYLLKKRFVAKILLNMENTGWIDVTFMRNYRKRNNIFGFPDAENRAEINKSEV